MDYICFNRFKQKALCGEVNIPYDCQMLIPSALYNNWKTATNWATYASKMVSV